MTYDEMLEKQQACKSIRKRPADEEHRLQVSCVRLFCMKHPQLSSLLIAVPNGGRRDAVTGAKLKAEGVVAGVSDLLLLVARNGYHGLCIEMKTPKGRQQDTQREWQKAVEAQGFRYVLCRSVEEFIKETGNYLDTGE